MIISPPILKTRDARTPDEAWVEDCMAGWAPGQAAYPINDRLEWHGGVHIQIDPQAPSRHPVRAISDGTVVFARKCTDTTDRNHPLWHAGGWTSDGCVVLRHDTEIGSGEQARLTFFSVYLHLSALSDAAKVGQKIGRKDEIGRAGYLYGQGGQIHIEICLDDANLRRLVGRSSATLDTSKNGRLDAVWGQAYFRLPAGTPIYAREPKATERKPSADTPMLPPLAEPMYVGLRWQAGDAQVNAWQEDGQPIGHLPSESGAEYHMHDTAQTLFEELRKAHGAGFSATPAQIHDLLRWGRRLDGQVIDVPHWRQVPINGSSGWVDLNAAGVTCFSDADWPHWRGWRLVDDDPDGNSRCDSQVIRQLLQKISGQTEPLSDAQAGALVRQDSIHATLRTLIAKVGSEWDASTADARWRWVTERSANNTDPHSPQDFAKLVAHVRALCIDCPALLQAKWRFDPARFIAQMRQCSWLSRDEVVQLVPDHSIRSAKKIFWEETPRANFEVENNPVLRDHRRPLNEALRRYGITSPLRMAAFFGNAVQETSWLGRLSEFGGGSTWYAPWYGRGFLQLTGPGNYINYWRWRGRHVDDKLAQSLTKEYDRVYSSKPRPSAALADAKFAEVTQQIMVWRSATSAENRDQSDDDNYSPADSAGWYWQVNHMARHADQPHRLERKDVMSDHGKKSYYRSEAFWRASASVNLPSVINKTYSSALNGFDSRCCAYGVALAVLAEMQFADQDGNNTLWYPLGYRRRT